MRMPEYEDGKHRGWSMTVGDMRKAIADVPDDFEIVLDSSDVDDCEIAELHLDSKFEPSPFAPGLIVVRSGQIISREYDYHTRLDFALDRGGISWDEAKQVWRQI